MTTKSRPKNIIIIILIFSALAGALLFILTRDTSALQVKCDVKNLDVFLDGKLIGSCPLSYSPTAGKHTLTLKKGIDAETYYFYEDAITVQNNVPLKVNAKLPSRFTDESVKKIARLFTDEAAKKIEADFVLVKGGCFQMGNVFGDGDRDERPVHEVCLDDFYMSKYETTQALWQKVMGNNPSYSVLDRLPVDNVSWKDIQEFVKKLNGMTGMNYRLPTEAEWEYAARSGGKREKWSGTNNENELPEYAWQGKNSEGTTHFVGLKKPNRLGLYDMTGNVRERVQDGWSRYGAAPQRNPKGPETMLEAGQQSMIRDNKNNFDRSMRDISMRDRFVGFRLAHSVSKSNP